MKKFYSFLTCLLLANFLVAQSTLDYVVMVEAEVEANPAQITLRWDVNSAADNYYIFRKSPVDLVWGSQIATLSSSDTSYVDTTAVTGELYDYRVLSNGSNSAYGYVRSGINVHAPIDRGGILVLVASNLIPDLNDELDDLKLDLNGDGYQVEWISASPDTTVSYVKSLVVNASSNMNDLQSIYIIGNVPVPYSGNLAPDGHVPDHVGAWPADMYYGDLNGTWTDAQINNANATDPRNHNVPGDGKFDQSLIPSDIELMVGRVDFNNLTTFTQDELELTKRYLQRVHDYKNDNWTLPKRGLVDDNFGGFSGEAFASNGWRNFSPLVGRENIQALDYRTTMDTEGYLFSYGCGGGSYTSAGGIGTSAQLATDSLLTGFTMLFGSYFGDWDKENNFMRSALAQGRTMSISWAGRPWWHYHPMGMGASIGECARLTMNNSTTSFQASYGGRFTHLALLGDPSLRMEYVAGPTQLAIDTVDTFDISLSWMASVDTSIDGYSIYQRLNKGSWERRGDVVASNTSFTDLCLLDSGMYEYSVRAFRLETSRSGSYYLESIGAVDSVRITTSKYPEILTHSFTQLLWGDPEGVFKAEGSKYVSSYTWMPFENGSPSGDTLFGDSVQSSNWYGFYDFDYYLIAANRCFSDTLLGEGFLGIGGIFEASGNVSIYPNPVHSDQTIQILSEYHLSSGEIRNLNGALVFSSQVRQRQFQLPQLPSGVYSLHLSGDVEVIKKLIVVD